MPPKTMINFISWWMTDLLYIKALVIELEESFSVSSSERYAGRVGEVEIWELLFLIVKNWPILTFTKCYTILQVSWADMTGGRMVLWSIYTKLRGPPAENWCCGLQVRITSCVRILRDCFLKTEKEGVSVAGIPLVPAEPLLPTVPATSFSDCSLDNFSAGILQLTVNDTKHT